MCGGETNREGGGRGVRRDIMHCCIAADAELSGCCASEVLGPSIAT
jgi:hypothetical protein